MRKIVVNLAALCLAGSANAAGLDLAGQPIQILFENGRFGQIGYSHVFPDNSGTVFGRSTGNASGDLFLPNISFKDDINERLSYAIILDRPFGREVDYTDADPLIPLLNQFTGSTSVYALTGLLQYNFDHGLSVYGGLRFQYAEGDATAFIPLAGRTTIDFQHNVAAGYVGGIAYEIPKYSVRFSLTYSSEIKHEFDTNINGGYVGVTNFNSPQSVNFYGQVPVSKSALVFGSVRWANWASTELKVLNIGPNTLSFQDSWTYTLGLAYKFNDSWTGLVSYTHDTSQSDVFTNYRGTLGGRQTVNLGAIYTRDKVRYTGFVGYTKLKDTSGVLLPGLSSTFNDNSVISVGLQIGYHFN